ncbi:hypothetical protein V866_005526 [Kwoniella sp. B9012]
MSLTASTPSSDIVPTTDNPPFDWLTVSPAEENFFSNDRRTKLRFHTAPSGNHVSNRLGSAYIYRGRTQGTASQGTITDGNELVPTHSSTQSLETRGDMGLKQYSIVDESFYKWRFYDFYTLIRKRVFPIDRICLRDSSQSRARSISIRKVRLANLEPQSHPTMDNFDAVESGCLYYIWRDLGNDDTRTGTFSPDRYYAQVALGR